MAVILDRGARSMMEEGRDEFYYVTAMNENYAQPSMPPGVEAGIVKGLYRVASHAAERQSRIGSLAWLRRDPSRGDRGGANAGGRLERFERSVERDQLCGACPRRARGGAAQPAAIRSRRRSLSHLAACLPGDAPIIAASDYVRAYPQLIASYVEAKFVALGTDGFGRSDTREALRSFFEVDRRHIVIAALASLKERGQVTPEAVAAAIRELDIDDRAAAPWTI